MGYQAGAETMIRLDDAVWLKNGLPAIVVGIHGAHLRVLWSNGHVTTIMSTWVVHNEPCPAGLTAPPLWS